MFLGILLVASMLSIKGKLPYTVILVFLGIGLSIVTSVSFPYLTPIQHALSQIRILADVLFSQAQQQEGQAGGLFVGLVVPPLIFEAMMHIRAKDLKAILRPALFLATIGVGLATTITGLLLWQVTGLSLAAALLFAAVISPTDTATVIEIFRRLRVPSKLSSLLELEAAFNDATAIVIFSLVLGSLSASPNLSPVGTLESFLVTFGGGVFIGFLIAFVSEILHSLISDRISETVLSMFAVYGSYTLATGFGFSGLISVAIVGLYFGNLTTKTSMTPTTREMVNTFWQIAAFIGNSIAFLFIGLETQATAILPSLGFIAIGYIAVMVSRIATVYPILTAFSRVGERIPLKWMNTATLGGMRGALSIALALSVTGVGTSIISSDDASSIKAMVFGIAFISIIVQGGFLKAYVNRMFRNEISEAQEREEESVNVKLSRVVNAIEELRRLREEGKVTTNDYNSRLQSQWSVLKGIIGQMETLQETSEIVKSRASSLYSIIESAVENAEEDLLNTPKKFFNKNGGSGNGRQTGNGNDETKNEKEKT